MKYLFPILLMVLIYSQSQGQILTILDAKTNTPVEFATVASNNPKIFVNTDAQGKPDISGFEKSKAIEIRIIGYIPIKTSYTKLKEDGFIVQLVESRLEMDEVVISANKWEQSVYEIPNKIISINENEIRYNNPQTSADMLASTGEVFVQKSQYGGGSPKLRGFAANSVLMVVDGVRMNNAIYRSGNLQNIISIDPNSLEGAEVVLGPGSVIYGSDALGGVMDFHTHSPRYSDSSSLYVGGSVMGRYASAGNENTTHADLYLGLKKVASYTSFSFSQFGNLKSGSNRPKGYDEFGKRSFYVSQDMAGNDIVVQNNDPNLQIGSGFDNKIFLQKINFRASSELELGYNFYYSTTSNVPRYDRLIESDANGLPLDAEWYYGPQKWMMHSLKAKFVRPTLLFDQLKVVLAYQDYEESRNDRAFGDNRLRTRTEFVDIFSANIDLDKELSKGNLYYGAEVFYNDIRSQAFRVNKTTGEVTFPSTRYPDGGSAYTSYATYLSHKWNINSFWVLNSGIRYSTIKLRSKLMDQSALNFPYDEFTVNNEAFNGSLGIVYSPNKRLKLSTSASSGFRAPNVDDVGKLFDFSNGEVQVPNTKLLPEYSYNLESGFEIKLNDILQFGGTGFYTLLNNAMVRRDFTFNGQDSIIYDGELSKVVALTNTGEAYIYGFSFESSIDVTSQWHLEGSVTGVYGKDKTNNEPLRHTTPLFGKINAIYSYKKLTASFFVEFNGSRFRDEIPPSEIDDKPFLYAQHNTDPTKDGTPAWYTLNLKAAYNISDQVQVSGGLENIMDLHYRPYSSGISAAGRNFIIALRAKL